MHFNPIKMALKLLNCFVNSYDESKCARYTIISSVIEMVNLSSEKCLIPSVT
jgi:hypothetical protein